MIAVFKPWLIYARVSTLNYASDGYSIEVQREATGVMLKALGHQRGESI
jgi:hypothetical protein